MARSVAYSREAPSLRPALDSRDHQPGQGQIDVARAVDGFHLDMFPHLLVERRRNPEGTLLVLEVLGFLAPGPVPGADAAEGVRRRQRPRKKTGKAPQDFLHEALA